jgi:hypothetical protein
VSKWINIYYCWRPNLRDEGDNHVVMIEELTTIALVEFDTHNRFKARAARGSAARGLEILDELDRLESK